MLFSPQRFTHRGAGGCFCYRVKVAIDIVGGAHIAISEPFPKKIHGHALGEERRGSGVAQIVEADLLQVMIFQKLPEMSGYEVGTVELPASINFFNKKKLLHWRVNRTVIAAYSFLRRLQLFI